MYGSVVSADDYPDVMNLTTGKPVTASGGINAGLANDGRRNDPNAYWDCDSAMMSEPWWQVDLERPAEVSRVVVDCYYADRRHYGFLLEGSIDGQNWTTLSDFRENKELSTINGYDCRFDKKTVRYTVNGWKLYLFAREKQPICYRFKYISALRKRFVRQIHFVI